jgi:hypothetical protein
MIYLLRRRQQAALSEDKALPRRLLNNYYNFVVDPPDN